MSQKREQGCEIQSGGRERGKVLVRGYLDVSTSMLKSGRAVDYEKCHL